MLTWDTSQRQKYAHEYTHTHVKRTHTAHMHMCIYTQILTYTCTCTCTGTCACALHLHMHIHIHIHIHKQYMLICAHGQAKRISIQAVQQHPWLSMPLASQLHEEAWEILQAEKRDRQAACHQPRAAKQVCILAAQRAWRGVAVGVAVPLPCACAHVCGPPDGLTSAIIPSTLPVARPSGTHTPTAMAQTPCFIARVLPQPLFAITCYPLPLP